MPPPCQTARYDASVTPRQWTMRPNTRKMTFKYREQDSVGRLMMINKRCALQRLRPNRLPPVTFKRMKKEDSRKTHPKLNDKVKKNIRLKLITSYVMIQKTTSNT